MDASNTSPPPQPSTISIANSTKSWPTTASSYTLTKVIGKGAFAAVYAAKVKGVQVANDNNAPSNPTTENHNVRTPNEDEQLDDDQLDQDGRKDTKPTGAGQYYPHCAIKVLDLESLSSSLSDIRHEVSIMRSISHSNVLDAYVCFLEEGESRMWLVSQIMAKGSCLNALRVLAERGITGFPEGSIKYVIHSTLMGLGYLHDNGHIHRD
eukprot:CAMPEP_0118639762 /NCGR_PEP_ID=MMETSP0785-20121206/4396_1 /TAXON_ID=91992 /ORGANISM="Bolidomonas pacifica, Strain CCMP 1866" /LENGTH=208 /DNA_ID=CAMNT_0006531111 /DNA_START=186 /DNA_END=809 /DNA_ORIENTATION=-